MRPGCISFAPHPATVSPTQPPPAPIQPQHDFAGLNTARCGLRCGPGFPTAACAFAPGDIRVGPESGPLVQNGCGWESLRSHPFLYQKRLSSPTGSTCQCNRREVFVLVSYTMAGQEH